MKGLNSRCCPRSVSVGTSEAFMKFQVSRFSSFFFYIRGVAGFSGQHWYNWHHPPIKKWTDVNINCKRIRQNVSSAFNPSLSSSGQPQCSAWGPTPDYKPVPQVGVLTEGTPVCMCLMVGKPTQTQGEHANSIRKGPAPAWKPNTEPSCYEQQCSPLDHRAVHFRHHYNTVARRLSCVIKCCTGGVFFCFMTSYVCWVNLVREVFLVSPTCCKPHPLHDVKKTQFFKEGFP